MHTNITTVEETLYRESVLESLTEDSETLTPVIDELLNTATTISHPDWEIGENCPRCGSHELSRLRTTTELIASERGTTQLRDARNQATDLAWWCRTCDWTVGIHPALCLSKTEPKLGIPTIPLPLNNTQPIARTPSIQSALLEESQTDTPWEPGECCPHCESTYIVQISIDVEHMVQGGATSYSSGDRLRVLKHRCENCGDPLSSQPISLLFPGF